jgi:phosphotriesterase-related protein
MGYVQTVSGPVDPRDLGKVLPHEHLGVYLWGGKWTSSGLGDPEEDLAVSVVGPLRDLGFRTVVEMTPYGMDASDPGRSDPKNVLRLRRIAERSGLHIVAGASTYLEPYMPQWILDADLEELEERFVRDATVGIGDTGIRVGIFGEQATGLNEVTPQEEKAFRAVARAARATGLAINTHTTHGTMALEQISMLREEGVDLSRVVIGHMDIQPDLDHVRRVLQTGVTVAFDTLGKQFWDFVLRPGPAEREEGEYVKAAYFRSDAARMENIARLIRDGFSEQIVMSMDMTGTECFFNPTTHGRLGLSFLAREVLPGLGKLGVSDAAVEQMVVTNPTRLLTIG